MTKALKVSFHAGELNSIIFSSGHRRFFAAQKIGLEEVDCVVYEPTNKADEEAYIIEANRSRQKTARQLRREGARLKELRGEAALRARK